MKKLLSLSVMLSLGLATVTPALNAAQSQAVAQSQKNPAHASGWQAAKKWWRSGRNMKALNAQEQRAFRNLRTKFAIGTIIAAIIAMIGGGAALAIGYKKRQAGQEAPPYVDAPPSAPAAGHLGQELIEAAARGDKAKVERLIAARADVNATDQYGWDQGYTALIWAAIRGHDDIVETLLQVDGIDVNAGPRGYTALMGAANNGHENIVYRLLQVDGIDVNATTIIGYTALIIAAYKGYEKIVKMLLDAGADKNLQNDEDETAEAEARTAGHENLANMIRDYVRSGGTVKSAKKDK